MTDLERIQDWIRDLLARSAEEEYLDTGEALELLEAVLKIEDMEAR